MAGHDADWPSEHGPAWSAATDAAQRLARSASDIVSSLHQTRVPDRTQIQRVGDTLTEMVGALPTLNELEKANG